MYDTSQHGQLQYIFDLFGGIDFVKNNPKYVIEIGAFDGKTNSNALPLFNFGWSGICIEPDPISFLKLQQLHILNDKVQTYCLCICDSDPTFIDFYCVDEKLQYNDHQLSTSVKSFSDKINNVRNANANIIKRLGLTLHDFYQAFVNNPVHYLSMDCECLDEKILLNTNFSIFRPKIIQAELQYDIQIDDIGSFNNTILYLKSNDYEVVKFPNSIDILAIDKNNCSDLNLNILSNMGSV